jgi:DNA invertase Pin-like site-specific DNA recombinase
MVFDPTIPLPTPEALAKTKAFYLTKFGTVLTDPEAYEICSLVVGFLYLTILSNVPCLRYGLYARKSDDDRSVTEKSIGEQVATCEKIAADHELVILRTWEESKSAKIPGIRVGYQELVAETEAGRINGILCWHINRLVRNMKEGGELVQLLVDGKIQEIRTPHARYQPDDNILPIVIEAASATQYSRDLTNVVKRSMVSNFERGNSNARAPQGYRNARNPTNLKRGIVERDEERFDKIRHMWELMLSGRISVTQAVNYLNTTLGYRTRLTKEGGGIPLSKSAGYGLFRNPFYMGLVRYKGRLTKGNHEAMVTPDEFAAVQAMLKKESFAAPHVLEHAFTGMMRCKHCGYQITADRKRLSTGQLWTSYRCSDSKLTCTKKGIDGSTVAKKVATILKNLRIDPEYVPIALSVIVESLQALTPDQTSQESVDRQLQQVDERLHNLEEMGLSGLVRDANRYRALQDAEYEKKKNLLVERGRITSEVARMKKSAERALTYAAFAEQTFLHASPKIQGSLASVLAQSYEFDGIAKQIKVTVKPILREIVRFVRGQIEQIEPALNGSRNKKELAFATPILFGGPKLSKIKIPEPLLKELRGPLFPEYPGKDGDLTRKSQS